LPPWILSHLLRNGEDIEYPEISREDILELEGNPAWLALKLFLYKRMLVVAWYIITHPEKDNTPESFELRTLEKLMNFDFSWYTGTAKPEDVKQFLNKLRKKEKKQ